MKIIDAIRAGQIDMVEQSLKIDPSVINQKDERGFTPLIMATYVGQTEIVKLLIQNGADINQKGAQGNTALMGVCFKGSQEMARLLIDAGADIQIKNDMGMTAIDFAKQYDQSAIVELLKSH